MNQKFYIPYSKIIMGCPKINILSEKKTHNMPYYFKIIH